MIKIDVKKLAGLRSVRNLIKSIRQQGHSFGMANDQDRVAIERAERLA